MKVVLTAAKILKTQFPNEDEEYILKQAICDIYLPKLTSQDVPIFQSIVSDLFKCKFSLPLGDDNILQFIIKVIDFYVYSEQIHSIYNIKLKAFLV